MKCHFVYSVPSTNRPGVSRISRRVRSILNRVGVPVAQLTNRHPSKEDLDLWPARSPYENTRNMYMALSKKMPTLLYHLTERVYCPLDHDDIFLGHPYFPSTAGCYGVTELAAKEKVRPSKFALITPLHCDCDIETTHINKAFLDDVDRLLPLTNVLFGIMGEYWWDQWDLSPYAHWKPKMIRLDMAVDVTRYPRIKMRFNPPGKRGYLYIGPSNDVRKGSDFLGQLMGLLDDYPKGWIGGGEQDIPNMAHISNIRPLTPAFMTDIAEKYDFLISPSRADPNPTTILESMAWGFPVLCTPQSGYYQTSYRRNLYLDDIDKSLTVLEELQYADEADLVRMADEARQVVEKDYTWAKFTSTVIKSLGL